MEAESNRAIAGALTLPPRRFTWNRADRNNHGETLPSCLLVTWFCGLLVTTPLYQPYPRLTLPWLMSAWLGAAAAIGWVSHRICLQSWPAKNSWLLRAGSAVLAVVWAALCGSSVVLGLLAVVGFWLQLRRRVPGWAILTVCLLVSVAAIVWSAGHHPSKGIPGWQPRTGLESIAARIVEDAGRVAKEDQQHRAAEPNLPDSLFYVYAEPGLVFHLAVINHRGPVNDFIVQPAGNLDLADPNARRSSIPTFLVTGPHAYRDRQFTRQLANYREQLRLVGTYPYVPSDLVLLNEYHPRELTDPEHRPEEEVRLYLLK